MKSLLNRTSRIYLFFAIMVLALSSPVFYLVIRSLVIEEADESLLFYKKHFFLNVLPGLDSTDIQTWNKVSRDYKIEIPSVSLANDSLFSTAIYDSLEAEEEPFRVLWTPLKIGKADYILSARVNQVESEDLVAGLAIVFISIISLLLLGMYFLSRFFSTRMWKPFYSSLEQIEKFQIDNLEVTQLPSSEITEFHRLNFSINKLIDKNLEIFRKQKEFIENAAHELQTPLAVFQAKLDLLIQHSEISGEQSEILQKLIESAGKLNRINKNLLLLSKIDKDYYPGTDAVPLKEMLTELVVFFKEQAKGKSIELQTNFEEEKLVNANYPLCEILFSNFLLNAIKHSDNYGIIHLHLTSKDFLIKNSGKTPLNDLLLFQRFSRSENSAQGSGLGLSIVKKIANLNNWGLSYNFENGFHLFRIVF